MLLFTMVSIVMHKICFGVQHHEFHFIAHMAWQTQTHIRPNKHQKVQDGAFWVNFPQQLFYTYIGRHVETCAK